MNAQEIFLNSTVFAVAGASRDPDKYGAKVLSALVASGRKVYPLNPTAMEIDGLKAYPSIDSLPEVPEALSIITPPQVTRQVVHQAIAAGIKHLWMQPGAEDPIASQLAREAGLSVIDDGSCILVSLAIERRKR